jgi:hypothetical protein
MNPKHWLVVAAVALTPLVATPLTGQTHQAYCPSDNVATVDDGGVILQGSSARQFVESFLSGDPYDSSRIASGTTGIDATMLVQLSDGPETYRYACRQLNLRLTGTESPPQEMAYFRAGERYFASWWTIPKRISTEGGATGYVAVLVFDLNYNLIGTWTA